MSDVGVAFNSSPNRFSGPACPLVLCAFGGNNSIEDYEQGQHSSGRLIFPGLSHKSPKPTRIRANALRVFSFLFCRIFPADSVHSDQRRQPNGKELERHEFRPHAPIPIGRDGSTKGVVEINLENE